MHVYSRCNSIDLKLEGLRFLLSYFIWGLIVCTHSMETESERETRLNVTSFNLYHANVRIKASVQLLWSSPALGHSLFYCWNVLLPSIKQCWQWWRFIRSTIIINRIKVKEEVRVFEKCLKRKQLEEVIHYLPNNCTLSPIRFILTNE